jgi:hypothetical protein
MIDLLEFKALLGNEATNLPIEEIERIRELEYVIADALFENWLNQRGLNSKSKLDNID